MTDISDDDKKLWQEAMKTPESTKSTEEDFEELLNTVDVDPKDLEEKISSKEEYEPVQRKINVSKQTILDLHGHDQEQAYRLLYDFLEISLKNGIKKVEVITGRGLGKKHGPENAHLTDGIGVLKQMVPRWLDSPKFNHLVKDVTESKTKGGFIITLK